MKNKALNEPLYLNLYNFDSSTAQNCQYILTSPRSLEACRRAGCKPIELLQRSLEEFKEDSGIKATEELYEFYTQQENDRLYKLETCRAIRKQLISDTQNEDSFWSGLVSSNNNIYLNQEAVIGNPLPYRNEYNEENTKLSGGKSADDNEFTTRHVQEPNLLHDLTLHNGKRNIRSESDIDGTFSEECEKKLLSNYDNRKATSVLSIPHYKSNVTKNYLNPANKSRSGSQKSSLISNSSPFQTTSNSPENSVTSYTTKSVPGSSSSYRNIWNQNSGFSTVQFKKYMQDLKRKKPTLKPSSVTPSSENNKSSTRSRSICEINQTHRKPKQVSFRYLSTDDLCLSEHDRRILDAMALKKEIEKEISEYSHYAQLLWEKDRKLKQKQTNEQKVQLQANIFEKRQLENIKNKRKWEEIKCSLKDSQRQLEEFIKQKGQKAARCKKTMEEKKMSEIYERSVAAAKHRAEVETSRKKMEIQTEKWQKYLDEDHKTRQEKANKSKNFQQETYRQRVASANFLEELRHHEQMARIKAETGIALKDLQLINKMREQKAQNRYDQILQGRNKHLKGQSFKRALKFQQIQQFQEDLNKGLEKWQNQVLRLQYEATTKAEKQVTKQREQKRQRIEMKNQEKQKHHLELMECIRQENEARVQLLQGVIAIKEAKMKRLSEERDMAIQESRSNAQSTADLREHLRCRFSPETFDQKVVRVALEMKLASRPPTTSPTMLESHIYLG